MRRVFPPTDTMAFWMVAVSAIAGLVEGVEVSGTRQLRPRAVMLSALWLLAGGIAIWQLLASLPSSVRGWAPTASLGAIAAHKFALTLLPARRPGETLAVLIRLLVHGSEATVAVLALAMVYGMPWFISLAAGIGGGIGIVLGPFWNGARRRWSFAAGVGMTIIAVALRPLSG